MNKKFDRIAGTVFLLIGLFFLTESQKLMGSAYGSQVGPEAFPAGLGILLIILSFRLLYETFKYKDSRSQKEKFEYKRFVLIFISAIIYIFLLEKIGYIISTFIFLIITFQIMERGKWLYSMLISAAFSFGVYFLYVELLGGVLPRFSLF
ncbi:tripartite tricarboxylate transporter TctB family protein [Caldifermentibacillus hisashii]|uniref:tripartite tricarboxylate transporter TctB family protein n=1 Tax=Caldifermentibacillus hisashii TaxID=996558 RepID=UPI0030D6BB31